MFKSCFNCLQLTHSLPQPRRLRLARLEFAVSFRENRIQRLELTRSLLHLRKRLAFSAFPQRFSASRALRLLHVVLLILASLLRHLEVSLERLHPCLQRRLAFPILTRQSHERRIHLCQLRL